MQLLVLKTPFLLCGLMCIPISIFFYIYIYTVHVYSIYIIAFFQGKWKWRAIHIKNRTMNIQGVCHDIQ